MEVLAARGFSLATDVADWLVRQRIPFAEAHEVAGVAVRYCEQRGIDLLDLTASDLGAISPLLTAEVLDVLTIRGSIDSRTGRGGTATVQVERQLREFWEALEVITDWLSRPTPPSVDRVVEEGPKGYWSPQP